MLSGMTLNRALVEVALFTPNSRGGWGAAVLTIGGPGVAKTHTWEHVCGPMGLNVQTLSPGSSGEGAFGVIPVPERRALESGEMVTSVTYGIPSYIFDRFGGVDGAGVLFVDEATSAPDHIQPSLLGLIGSGVIGFTRLGKRIRVVGAANPPEIAADGRDLSAPLANRFIWLDWGTPEASDVIAYLTGARALSTDTNGPARSALEIESDVLAAWDSAWARTVGVHAGYLRANPSAVYDLPKDPHKASGPWASPRSWENGLRAITTASILGHTGQVRSLYLAGAVGAGHADAWEAFEANADLPNVEEVLDGKLNWSVDDKRPDRAVAVLAACTTLLASKDPATATLRKARADRLWSILDSAPSGTLDLVAQAATSLTSFGYASASGAAGRALRKLKGVVT
jgi:MoxR-like ATPase